MSADKTEDSDTSQARKATTKTCSACKGTMPVDAWKCRHCQTAHGWHSFFSLGIPALSLLVAAFALLPIAIPPVRDWIDPPTAEIFVNARYVDGRGELEFEFVNIGRKAGIIPQRFDCLRNRKESTDGFFARAPVIVPPESTVLKVYEVNQFDSADRHIDVTLSGFDAKQQFFSRSRINTVCVFAAPNDDVEYYDFGETEFFIGFNILYNVPLSDTVEFRFDVQ